MHASTSATDFVVPGELRGPTASPRLRLPELVIPTNRKARRAEASLKRRRHQ